MWAAWSIQMDMVSGNQWDITAPSESLGGGCFCSLDLFSKNVRINYIFDLTGADIKHIVESTQDEQDSKHKGQDDDEQRKTIIRDEPAGSVGHPGS